MISTETEELTGLVEAADPDWMRDALHAVVAVLAQHQGSLANQIVESLRYELVDPDPVSDDAFGFPLPVKPGLAGQ